MKHLFIFIIVAYLYSCKSSHPIYTKNVYVNGVSVKVDKGYIKKYNNYYLVNGIKYRIEYYKPTTDSNYTKRN